MSIYISDTNKPGQTGSDPIDALRRLVVACTRAILHESRWRGPMRNRPVLVGGGPDHRRCGTNSNRVLRIVKPATPSSLRCAERVLTQEIEVAAAVGLQDLAAVKEGVPALRNRRRGDW